MSDSSPAVSPISHPNVVPVGDEIVVTWRGGSPEMSVFLSDSPFDAGTDVRAPDAPGSAVLPRGSARAYVHLFEPSQGFVVAAERRIEMDGPSNFRDLGGYPTMDGSWTRWGQVFRSDGLHELSDADHALMSSLGITTIFDLRSDEEVAHAPDRVPDGVRHVHLPMSSDVAKGRTMLQRILDGDLEKFDEDDMAAGYLRMLKGFPDYLKQMVTAVGDDEKILFHCTAGKDRTGITAMVLLGMADVANSFILDDYEVSAQYRAHSSEGTNWFMKQIQDAGRDPNDYHAMWGSPRPAMRKTLDSLSAEWGDVGKYLQAIGVDAEIATSARQRMRIQAD